MLLIARETRLSPHTFAARSGNIFAVFDERTQDSGNVSYGVTAGDQRYFIKTAGSESSVHSLPIEERVALLRNAIRLNRSVTHRILPSLRNVIESGDGPILVYDWVDGELLGVAAEHRSDPASAYFRFRRLPVREVLNVLDAIIDLHDHLASNGWIAVDFYDGSIIYDFLTGTTHVVDLDSYHFGAFVNRVGRLFGSTRFMAPEEFQLGAEITERTNVFMLGRAVFELLSEGVDGAFRGPPELLALAQHACCLAPDDRFASVRQFSAAWAVARSSTGARQPQANKACEAASRYHERVETG